MTKRVAILGMGRWGLTWKRVIEGFPGVEVVGSDHLDTGDRRPDYRDILAEPDLDAAIITLPVGLHLAAIKEATSRGIPVLCEKPLVADREELQELLGVVEASDVVVRVGQNYRRRGWVGSVRHALRELGSIRHVRVTFAQPEFVDGGRGELAHPLLDDMAIHHMDLLRHLTGLEATVLGAWSARPEPTAYAGGTDLDAVLRLSQGALVSYSGSWAARGATTPWDGDWEIRCDEGTVRVRNLQVAVEHTTGRFEHRSAPRLENENADLSAVWSDFMSAIEGDPNAGVTVADNARSIGLVFDLAELALNGTSDSPGSGRDEQK